MGNLVLGLNNLHKVYLTTPSGVIALEFWFDNERQTEKLIINAPNEVKIDSKKKRKYTKRY